YLRTKFQNSIIVNEFRQNSDQEELTNSLQSLHVNEKSTKLSNIINYYSSKFIITDGFKFGCDFVLYAGPPPCHHSLYCVSVYDYDQPINPLEIISKMRSSHSKSALCLPLQLVKKLSNFLLNGIKIWIKLITLN
ncbi:hypothetical protein MXB_458, partial [Myxobolus squamalis]